MPKNNNIVKIQFCYVKLKSLESDVKSWNVESLRDADKAEVYALIDRIRGVKHEMDAISTLQLAKLTKKEVKDFENRCQDLMRQWKELRAFIGTMTEHVCGKHFKILKIKPTTDWNEIKKAYKKRAQETHPDHNGGRDVEFLKVKEAYDELKKVYEK